jgi:hypothetical protein
MHSDTLVIIPAYNEERAIAGVVASVKEMYPVIDIAVVNDGSADGTAYMALSAGAIVLSHPFNMGYGVALQTGYKYAMRHGYRYLVQMDGDGQHDPGGIGALLDAVKNDMADVALGSRFVGSGSYHPTTIRLLGIKFFRFILFLLSGRHINDITTGFQAMNLRVLNLFIQDVFPCDYPDADIILLLSRFGFRITEVPVTMYANQYGKSMHHNPVKVMYYVFKMFLSLLLTKLRKYSVPGLQGPERNGG